MLINFTNSFKNNYQYFKTSTKTFMPTSKMPSFMGDTFQKNEVDKTKEVELHPLRKEGWDEIRFQKLYDEVYDDTAKLNPIIEELNFKKPKSVFSYDPKMTGRLNYNFTNNTITFNMNKLKGDYYFCFLKDKNDKMCMYCGIHNEKQIKADISKIQRSYPDYKFEKIKLTDIEKEAFVKANIIHEIRHSVQSHLAASTKGCKDKLKDFLVGVFEQTKKSEEDYSQIEYLNNFVPKKIILEDKKLKYSLNPDDCRYLSTQDHIYDYTIKLAYNINDRTLYYSSPMEADSTNHEYEYFEILRNSPKYAGMREFMANNIGNFLHRTAETNLRAMEVYGFPKLSEKTNNNL